MNILKVKFNFRKQTAQIIVGIFCLCLANIVAAKPRDSELLVWVSEAVVATYTYDFKDFLKQQKVIAKYFTADGWVNYSKALTDSKVIEIVKKNTYYVSAVPTMPPKIKNLSENEWEAVVDVLVLYQNPAFKQKQNLKVTVNFVKSNKEGMRGFAITRIRSIVTEPPCKCANKKSKAVATIV